MFKQILVFLSSTLLMLNLYSQANGIFIQAEYKSTRTCSSDSSRYIVNYSLRQDLLKVDLRGPRAQNSIIYQPSTNTLWMVYHVEKAFYSMTGEMMKTYNREVEKQAEEFIQSLEKMDEKTREQTKVMWPTGNPFAFEYPEYELKKKEDSLVSQLLCKKYYGVMTNGNEQYVYLNNLKYTGMKKTELQILTDFMEFMGSGVKAMSGNLDFTAIHFREEGGMPILIENKNGDNLCSYFWVKHINRMNLEDSEFQIPITYSKINNPLGYK